MVSLQQRQQHRNSQTRATNLTFIYRMKRVVKRGATMTRELLMGTRKRTLLMIWGLIGWASSILVACVRVEVRPLLTKLWVQSWISMRWHLLYNGDLFERLPSLPSSPHAWTLKFSEKFSEVIEWHQLDDDKDGSQRPCLHIQTPILYRLKQSQSSHSLLDL